MEEKEYTDAELNAYRKLRIDPLEIKYKYLTRNDLIDAQKLRSAALTQQAEGQLNAAMMRLTELGLFFCSAICERLAEDALAILKDASQARWCAQAPRGEIDNHRMLAIRIHEGAIEKQEQSSNLEDMVQSLERYVKAIDQYEALLRCFDEERLEDFPRFASRTTNRAYIFAILIAIVTNVGTWYFTTN